MKKIAKELEVWKVGVDPSDKISDLKKKLKEDEKQRHEQFLRRKLEEYGTDAGDRNLVEMLACLKSAVEETDKDFNSAWMWMWIKCIYHWSIENLCMKNKYINH